MFRDFINSLEVDPGAGGESGGRRSWASLSRPSVRWRSAQRAHARCKCARPPVLAPPSA